jgi:acyl-CoA thioesterase
VKTSLTGAQKSFSTLQRLAALQRQNSRLTALKQLTLRPLRFAGRVPRKTFKSRYARLLNHQTDPLPSPFGSGLRLPLVPAAGLDNIRESAYPPESQEGRFFLRPARRGFPMEELTQEELKTFFHRDLFAAYVGIELLEAGSGRAVARLSLREHHRNGLGMVQGGAIFPLADLAFAAAVNSRGRTAVAIHASISYLKAAQGEVLTADAQEVSCGPKIAAYTIRITESSGELIALFEGMAYRKKERLSL